MDVLVLASDGEALAGGPPIICSVKIDGDARTTAGQPLSPDITWNEQFVLSVANVERGIVGDIVHEG